MMIVTKEEEVEVEEEGAPVIATMPPSRSVHSSYHCCRGFLPLARPSPEERKEGRRIGITAAAAVLVSTLSVLVSHSDTTPSAVSTSAANPLLRYQPQPPCCNADAAGLTGGGRHISTRSSTQSLRHPMREGALRLQRKIGLRVRWPGRRCRVHAVPQSEWQALEDDGEECKTSLFHLEKAETVTRMKNELLSAIAGLDRGLSASQNEAKKVDELAKMLELEGTSVDFVGSEALEAFKGSWRLLYSSGFNSGSLGGRRPGPIAAFSPLSLGQVFQNIDDDYLDNVVELTSFLLTGQDAFEDAVSRFPGGDQWQSNRTSRARPPTARACLRHTYKLDHPNKVTITFESTTVKPLGSVGGLIDLGVLPEVSLPRLPEFIQPPAPLRSAMFDVTYLDGDFRVTRGDRGELRIYSRVKTE